MGKSSKTSTQSNSQTSLTQTPTNPSWVDQGLAGAGANVNALTNADPYSFVAGPSALQNRAAAGAGDLSGTPWAYDASSGIAGGVANAAPPSIAGHLAEFQNPYTNQVVNTSLADFDQNAGVTQAQNKLALAGDTTFGGSGGAIQTNLSNDALTRARATLDAQMRNQGFETALGGATSQAGLDSTAQAQRLTAAGLISSNANDYGANQRANIGTQADVGSILQALAQQKAAAPLGLAATQAGLYSTLPLGLLHGQTANGTESGTSNSQTSVSDPMGTLAGLMQGAGSLASGLAMFSDRRMKTDIKKVGKLDDGLAVYQYRYKAGGPMQIGVMAQEVAKVKPQAVHNIGGLLAVDYGQLGSA